MFDISKYDPTELSYIVDPKTEEEMIAIARAIKVIKTQREELKRLRELARADADGRLVVLPCKPGDTIYRPDGLQYSWEIVSITIYPDEIIFTDDSDNIFGLDNIGKTIFFTREEAEKALGGGGDA